MIVTLVLGLLASIALLKYIDLRNTARAAQVAGDFRTVLVGSYNYYSDFNAWPSTSAPGVIPAGFTAYLPGAFTFSRPEYTLQYENLGVGGGAYMVGVTVSTTDADLMSKLIRNLGSGSPYFVGGGTLTYIIVGSDGKA